MGLLDFLHGTGGGLLGGSPQTVQTPSTAQPSFGQRLNTLLQSDAWLGTMAGLASGSDLQDSLGRASVGYAAGKRSDTNKAEDKARKDQLNAWIKAKSAGLAPEDAALLAANPDLAANYAADILKPKPYEKPATTADITEYNYAKNNGGFTGSFMDWKKQGGGSGGTGEYGLAPVWGTGADGRPALIQLGKNGQPIQPQLPEGFQIARDPIKVDLGTSWGLLDPQTRQMIGQVPKDIAGEAQQTAVGKGAGEAQNQLPAAQQTAAMMSQQINDLKNDPYLPRMVGSVDGRLPNVSSDAARVQAKIDQIKGGTFLQARQLLKGGGPITDYEGMKADSAMARLSQAQTEQDFNAALDDLNAAVQQGLQKLQAQAGGGGVVQAPAPPQMQPQAAPMPSQAPANDWQTLPNGVRIRQVQ